MNAPTIPYARHDAFLSGSLPALPMLVLPSEFATASSSTVHDKDRTLFPMSKPVVNISYNGFGIMAFLRSRVVLLLAAKYPRVPWTHQFQNEEMLYLGASTIDEHVTERPDLPLTSHIRQLIGA